MAQNLAVLQNGHLFPYSLVSLKKDYPSVSFPSVLTQEMLTPYGVFLVDDGVRVESGEPAYRVSMPQFLYGLRDFGLRVQFENYVQRLDGHARDYWLTAAYVNRGHVCVKHFAEFFSLTKPDLDAIFSVAGSIEE